MWKALGFTLRITAHPIEGSNVPYDYITITFRLCYEVITAVMSCHILMSYRVTPTALLVSSILNGYGHVTARLQNPLPELRGNSCEFDRNMVPIQR